MGPLDVEDRGAMMPVTLTNEVDPLLDLDLPVSVRFGKVKMPLAQALELGDGSIVELDSRVDDPVEVLVHGKVVALGQLVVVDGHYGVEVTSLAGNGSARAEVVDDAAARSGGDGREEFEES